MKIALRAVLLVSFFFSAIEFGFTQSWTHVASWPQPPVVANAVTGPANATPFWRGWTKPVYDPVDGGLLNFLANPNCCGGTFSNALFLYRVQANEWKLKWSHLTTEAGKGPADAADAPADTHPYHVLAWDSKRAVLWKGFGSATHGGTNGNCGDCGVSDLYKFDPKTAVWTEVCGNGMSACPPGPVQEAAMVYDPQTDSLILYGGLYGGAPADDTWQYFPEKNDWKHVCGRGACGPPPVNAEGLVYDAALQRVILFGGTMPRGRINDQTWMYDPTAYRWKRVETRLHPPASKFPVMDYVPRLQRVVLIGSEKGGAHTWTFDGKDWSDLGIAGGPTLSETFKQNQGAYDVSADRFVLLLPSEGAQPASVWSLTLPSSPRPQAGEPNPVKSWFTGESQPASFVPEQPKLISVSAVSTHADRESASELVVPLTIQEALFAGRHGIQRHEDPVTVGVPVPDSAKIKDASQLGVKGSAAGQFRVMGRWPDGNVKWVLVDMQADVAAGGRNSSIAITPGKGNFGGADLAQDQGGSISVTTGAAKFTIRKRNFDLIDAAVVGSRSLLRPGGSTGLVIVGPTPGSTQCPCSTLYSSTNDNDSTAVIEENGPVRAVIKASGQLQDKAGHSYMRFTVRLSFYKNKTWTKAVVILQNADYGPSQSFASAYKGFSAFEARLSPELGSGRGFSFGTAGSPSKGTFAGTEDAFLYQAYSTKLQDCDWIAPGSGSTVRSYITRKLLQRNSCQSVWQYAQEGYDVAQEGKVLTRGDRSNYAAGWADLHEGSGAGVEIGVYELAAYWPKSLQFMNGGSEIRIGIWPDQSLYGTGGQQYFQSWPQYSIHSVFLNFHTDRLEDPAAEFNRFQYPLLARAPLAYYNQTQAFMYPLVDADKEDKYIASLGVTCCIRDLDSAHVYRTYNWPGGGGGNQAEMRWADLMLWLQRGFTGRYVNSGQFYTFQSEQVFPRSDYMQGRPFNWRDRPQSELDGQGFPDEISSLNDNIGCDPNYKHCGRNWVDAQHAHWYGMIDYYFLSGDETIKDAIEDGASDTYANPKVRLAATGHYWAARDVGVALMSDARLALFYRTIGNQAAANDALSAGEEILHNQVWPELQLSGFGTAEQGVSRTRGVQLAIGNSHEDRFAKPFQQGILEEGLWEFLQAAGPTWPHYWDTMDLAYGIGKWSLTEGWRTNGNEIGCRKNSSFTYEVFIDKPNNPLEPSCSQTCWFNLYDVAKYTGNKTEWLPQFNQYLRHLNLHGGFYAEYGTIFSSVLVNEALHPEPVELTDVAVTVKRDNQGGYVLSWKVPAGAKAYRIKYSEKNIVDWLNFDPVSNTFAIDPHTNTPWFAAPALAATPQPDPAGSTQTLRVDNLEKTKTWHFALKAYTTR